MTPRKPHQNDPVTWDGVEIMIRAYDQDIIIPRQSRQHEENQNWLRRLECSIAEVKETVDSWKWPVKIIMGMLTLILAGVIALVFDFVKWGIHNNWHWS